MFSARRQHVLSFSHWAHNFLAIFSKGHQFVQNSVVRTISASFDIFAMGAPLFSDFQQRARVCTKQRFQPKISTFCSFRTGHTTFQLFSAKCTILDKTAFSERDQHVLLFSHWAHHFLATFNKVREIVQDSVFSPRPARFVIFALGVHFLHFSAKRTSLYKAVFSARDQNVLSFSHLAHYFLSIF